MKRYWEVDAFRGLAILCMIIFHVFFIMVFFNIVNIDLWSGFFWWFPRFIASSFLFTVGVSLTLSHAHAEKRNLFSKFLKRGLKILGMGLVITAVTFSGFMILEKITGTPQVVKTVFFGILHCIGVSVIIGYFFIRFKVINIIIGLAVMMIGFYINEMRFDFPWLFWLGFWPKGYYPIDYEPLLPWIGPVFLGLAFGNIVYKNGTRPVKIKEPGKGLFSAVSKFLAFLGRHSIIIYLFHVPVLAGVIFGINFIIGLF